MPIRVQVPGHGIVEFPDGTSPDDMRQALASLSAPTRPVRAEDFMAPSSAPEGSALGRFASGVGAMLNPVSAAEGLYQAVRHPIDTAVNLGQAQYAQGAQAVDLAKQGRYTEALGHGMAAAFPLLGPAAAQAGEQIASGDIAGGLGSAAGLLAPMAVPAAARAAARALPATLKVSIAESLAAKAAQNVADVMTPKVGANKVRFAVKAANVAPQLATEDIGAWSRQGLSANLDTHLAQAEQGLDAATDARLGARAIETQPIIADLLQKRAALTAEAVDATAPVRAETTRTSPILDAQGHPIQVTSAKAVPLGRDVVPSPNAARVAQIDKAIQELRTLGPVTRYDPLRVMRQAYDGPAKAVYNPSLTQDFLTAQGSKLGAADVTGTLRQTLAQADPVTAAANAKYSLYRSATDLLQAVQETEAARPTVGRRIIARMAGTILGEQAGGVAGAAAGYALGPSVDALASAGWTTQLKTAQLLQRIAGAMRSGNEGAATGLIDQLKSTVKALRLPAAVQTNRETTSPSGSPAALLPVSGGQP